MAVASLTVSAQGTHLWTQSRLEEFEKGTPQGVALTSDGHLREGPGLTELLTTPSTFVWSVAVDKNGTAYLGTASPATVLRVGQDGKPFTLFETNDLACRSFASARMARSTRQRCPAARSTAQPDATAKQDEASATVVFDAAKLDEQAGDGKATGKGADGKTAADEHGEEREDPKQIRSQSHYIWDMTFDAAGRLYIATGGPGAVYRVDLAKPGAKPELFFKSDERTSAPAWDAKGNLIAGSDGSGLVYRISPEGKGYVLFEAPRREITSVAVAADGTIYAASVGDKSHNPLPPLPVQGAGSVTITIVQPGSLQAANASTSVPEGTEIYALDGRPGAAQTLGRQRRDRLRPRRAARRPARPHRQSRPHLPHRRRRQLRRHRPSRCAAGPEPGRGAKPEGTAASSSAPATPASSTVWATAEKHEYASDVLDAGALARFGRVEVEPGSAGYRTVHPHRQRRAAGARLDRLAAAQRRRSSLARRPLPAMEGRAAREWLAWAAWASTTCPSTPRR